MIDIAEQTNGVLTEGRLRLVVASGGVSSITILAGVQSALALVTLLCHRGLV